MKINLTENICIESEIPLLNVKEFHFEWKVNQHAELIIKGCADSNIDYRKEQLYDSKIKLWTEQNHEEENLFWGYVVKTEERTEGSVKQVVIRAKSASWLLDWKKESRSFQNVDKTYAEIARETVNDGGGQIICTEGKERGIGKPVIQYEETVWEFVRRMSSHLGTCIIPDIKTGRPNIWFGMRKGQEISDFSENEYICHIRKDKQSGKSLVSYEVESREFYRIGDKTRFTGTDMTICEVEGCFVYGELTFRYILQKKAGSAIRYQHKFTGLTLMGAVRKVYKDRINVVLDIDGGASTGNYFYNWYPETGNVLYAMPEPGARICLYFGSKDEREGYAVHCIPNTKEEEWYRNRYLETVNKNSVHLFDETIDFSQSGEHSLSLCDNHIAVDSVEEICIEARDKVRLSAERIHIKTPDELNICQG